MLLSRRTLLATGLTAGAVLPALRRTAWGQASPDTLRFGLSSYPPNLQPWINSGGAAGSVAALLHRGLLSYAADGSLQGELAESWQPEGDKAWVFRLRQAFFHNGAPVTAADIQWNIEQVAGEKSTAYLRTQLQGVERVETPDDRTVRLVMKQPTVCVPHWFANYYMPMVAKGSTADDPLGSGAGPFVLQGQERGVSLDLVAFDKYYKPGLPKLKAVKVIAYPDESLRVAALQAGDVDLIDYVPWQSMQSIEADQNLKLDNQLGPFMYLTFNGKTGPFADSRIRKAVALGIKRDEIVQAAFFGRGAPLEGLPFPPETPFYDEAAAHGWRYDLDKAKALLAEAGVADGFSCKLLSTAQYGMHKSTAEVIQQNLAELGIQVELNMPDWPSRVSLGNRGQYEFAVMGTAMESPDPESLSSFVDSSLSPSYIRSTGITVPGLNELLAAGRGEFDTAKRREIYAKAGQLVLDQAPMVTLAYRAQGFAMRKALQGFRNLPGGLSFYSATTLDQSSFA
jgi:peptide/nickel transport system substrate-binding protein